MQLLGQNPDHHVTPSSGLIELFATVQKAWPNFLEFKAEGLKKVKPRINTSLKGLIEGYFEEVDDKIVFDKNRGWIQYIEDLEQCMGKVKCIVPVRDVREILASFEKLYRKRQIDWRYPVGEDYFKAQTTVGRCNLLLEPGNVVGLAVNRVRDAIQRRSDNLIVLPYNTLASDPLGTLNTIHEVLELPQYDYNVSDVKQITEEDDTWHGMDLHVIKPGKVRKAEKTPWKGILPEEYVQEIEKRYADINKLSDLAA